MNRFVTTLLALAALSTVTLPGFAQSRETPGAKPESWQQKVSRRTEEGSFLPLSFAPNVVSSAGQVVAFGGFNSATDEPVMTSRADIRLIGPLALRVGAELHEGEELGPFVGAEVQILSQDKHGLNGAAALFYKAEGFDEAEGEIEGVLAAGARVGRVLLVGNLAYGQDPEGNERDGEMLAAALVRLSSLAHLGVDARFRFDLGSNEDKLRETQEPMYDLDAGPVFNVAVGPVALAAHAGISVIRRIDQKAQGGAIAVGGVGTAF